MELFHIAISIEAFGMTPGSQKFCIKSINVI